jgi:putative peptide zinc metalloprotease protein
VPNPNPANTAQDSSIRLKAGIRFVPERSEAAWHCVLEDTTTKRFFRIGRREYLIASCLHRTANLTEIGKLLKDAKPELKIHSMEIEQTIRWLINVGLVTSLNTSNSNNSTKSGTPSQPAAAGNWIDPFMMRFTLVSGDSLERWLRPLLFLVSAPLIVLAACLMMLASILFFSDYSDLMGLTGKLFVPSAAGWWIIAWLVMKAFHELGHALVCMGHGGQVRGAGVAIFYFAPIPYVDTTDMWRLSSRKARAFCALGGIWFEMTVAAIAILICQATENSSLQYFCISLATMGTFTTIAFNANPLARFDGYFVLSDLLNRPNLWTESQQALRSVIQEGWTTVGHSSKAFHSVWLTVYGALALMYRYTMMIAIGWGAWLTYRGVGLGLITLAVYLWFVAPWLKARQLRLSQQMLSPNPLVEPKSWRSPKHLKKVGLIVGAAIGCIALLFVPSPWQPAAPGYVVFEEPITLRSQTEGIVGKVYFAHGDVVQEGESIVEIENPLLQLQVAQLRCDVEMGEERCRVLRAQDRMAEYQSEQARLVSTQEQLNQAEEKLAGLTIRAPKTGRLIARELNRFEGQFIKPGQPIANIAASSSIEIHCSLPQDDVEMYRRQIGKAMKVSVASGEEINATLKDVLPRATEVLENPALAARYGGPIGVQLTNSSDSKAPIKTLRPRFEAKISIDPTQSKDLSLGEICNVHPASESFTLANVIGRWKTEIIHWLFPIGNESAI